MFKLNCKNNSMKIRTSIDQAAPHESKVDIDVLKQRVFIKERKAKFQGRIIFASVIISLGLISYFSV